MSEQKRRFNEHLTSLSEILRKTKDSAVLEFKSAIMNAKSESEEINLRIQGETKIKMLSALDNADFTFFGRKERVQAFIDEKLTPIMEEQDKELVRCITEKVFDEKVVNAVEKLESQIAILNKNLAETISCDRYGSWTKEMLRVDFKKGSLNNSVLSLTGAGALQSLLSFIVNNSANDLTVQTTGQTITHGTHHVAGQTIFHGTHQVAGHAIVHGIGMSSLASFIPVVQIGMLGYGLFQGAKFLFDDSEQKINFTNYFNDEIDKMYRDKLKSVNEILNDIQSICPDKITVSFEHNLSMLQIQTTKIREFEQEPSFVKRLYLSLKMRFVKTEFIIP